MRPISKTISTAIVILTCRGIGFSFAANNDCWLVNTTSDITNSENYIKFLDTISSPTLKYDAIVTSGALAKSFENLKKYCCQHEKNMIGNERCKSFNNGINFPESAYLYDHLIDVGFRILDGRSDLSYGINPDEIGKAWRDFITKAAEEKDGTTPQVILDMYKKYWVTRKTLPGDKTGFIQNYNDVTQVSLKDKYFNLCQIMKEIYNQLPEKNIVIGDNEESFYAKCQSLAEKRISDEYLYTKVIISKKSNELLHTTTQAFLQNYFIQDKMAVLINTINKIKDLFFSMVQGAAASKSCSK